MEQSDALGILKQLERGEITSEQADERLNESPRIERMDEPPFDAREIPGWMRAIWAYVLVSGLVGVGIGAWIIIATQSNVLWFLCGLPVLLVGALITALAASAQTSHWLYVNVNESGRRKHRVRFAMPFPFGLVRIASWFVKWIGKSPRAGVAFRANKANMKMDWSDIDAFLDALERELREGRGVTVDVDDENERVQVYIV